MALWRRCCSWRFCANLAMTATAYFLMLGGLFGVVPYVQMGFRCNDPKLSHKFTGDSVTPILLLAVTFLSPALVLGLTEWSFYNAYNYKSWDSSASTRKRNFWQWYGYYAMGVFYSAFAMEMVKLTIGEPRPHFIDSCKPREMINCTGNEFIKSYTCTNTKLSTFYLVDSDKSFFSGHAALSMFTATFLSLYAEVRIPKRLVPVTLKPFLHSLSLVWGIGVAVSRVVDNRHHWWDVLFGGFFGVCYALYVVRVYCNDFSIEESSCCADTSIEDDTAMRKASSEPPPEYPRHKKRHSSIIKLLSNFYSHDLPSEKEMDDIAAA